MLYKYIADIHNPNSWASKFRSKRFKIFEDFITSNYNGVPIEVLDVGGTIKFWQNKDLVKDGKVDVTCINLSSCESNEPNLKQIIGDATNMSEIEDKSFFCAFSNSVIEHLFTWDNQIKMAGEIQRCANYFFIQTPNKYFFLEPHFLMPWFQFYPKKLRIFLIRHFNLGHVARKDNYASAREQIEEVRLLSKKEMKKLFNSSMYLEKVFGLTKSITAHNFS